MEKVEKINKLGEITECIVTRNNKEISRIYYGGDLDEIEIKGEQLDEEICESLIIDYENKQKYGSVPEPTRPRITTITKTCKIVSCGHNNEVNNNEIYIDLDTLYRKIKLDKQLFSVKLKGLYRNFTDTPEPKKTKREPVCKKHKVQNCQDCKKNAIYNQCTVIVYIDPDRDKDKKLIDKEKINVKIFKNGELQMTGIRNLKNAEFVQNLIISKLKELHGTHTVTMERKNGIIIDSFNKVYNNKLEQIGFYQNDQRTKKIQHTPKLYIWNGSDYSILVEKGELLIEQFYKKKDKNLSKKVFNKNGEFLGEYQILFNEEYLKSREINLDESVLKIQENAFIVSTKDTKCKWNISDQYSCVLDKKNYQVAKIIQTKPFDTRLSNKVSDLNKNNKFNKVSYSTNKCIGSEEEFKGTEYKVEYYCIKNYRDSMKIVNETIRMMNSVFDLNLSNNKLHLGNLNKLLVKKYNRNSIYNPSGGYTAMNTKYYFNTKNEIENGICKCSKEACVYCLHERKHEKVCNNCEIEMTNTGNLCNSCKECKTCIHQSKCKVKTCNECICTCDPCDCICISLLCFHSGKIITSGSCNDFSQIETAFEWFKSVFQREFYDIIV